MSAEAQGVKRPHLLEVVLALVLIAVACILVVGLTRTDHQTFGGHRPARFAHDPCWSPFYPDNPGVITETNSVPGSPTTSYGCGG